MGQVGVDGFGFTERCLSKGTKLEKWVFCLVNY